MEKLGLEIRGPLVSRPLTKRVIEKFKTADLEDLAKQVDDNINEIKNIVAGMSEVLRRLRSARLCSDRRVVAHMLSGVMRAMGRSLDPTRNFATRRGWAFGTSSSATVTSRPESSWMLCSFCLHASTRMHLQLSYVCPGCGWVGTLFDTVEQFFGSRPLGQHQDESIPHGVVPNSGWVERNARFFPPESGASNGWTNFHGVVLEKTTNYCGVCSTTRCVSNCNLNPPHFCPLPAPNADVSARVFSKNLPSSLPPPHPSFWGPRKWCNPHIQG